MEGWIKIHRKLLEWEWYDDEKVVKLFLHLLLTCNFEKKRWRGVDVDAGERVTSLQHLAEECHLSLKSIRVALNKLKTTGEVAHQTTNRYSLIKLNNWQSYQQEGMPVGSQGASKGQQLKNDKNDKKKEVLESGDKSPTPTQISSDFFNDENFRIEFLKSKYTSLDNGEVEKFISYWTEPNKSGSKMRWQLEKTFEVKRRLDTWFARAGQFKKNEGDDIVEPEYYKAFMRRKNESNVG